MSKIAAEKRTRTYSVDDHVLANENVQPDVHVTAPSDSKVPEVAVTSTSHSSLHNKLLDVDGAKSKSRQHSFSLSASQRSIARRNAANPFARAVSFTSFTANTRQACEIRRNSASWATLMAAVLKF